MNRKSISQPPAIVTAVHGLNGALVADVCDQQQLQSRQSVRSEFNLRSHESSAAWQTRVPSALWLELLLYANRCCGTVSQMKPFKIVIEKHPDGYVAYPLGLKGVAVGQGDTDAEALADCQSAIRFHLETFGPQALDDDSPVLEAYIAEAHA